MLNGNVEEAPGITNTSLPSLCCQISQNGNEEAFHLYSAHKNI
jgi:hypothetical protein